MNVPHDPEAIESCIGCAKPIDTDSLREFIQTVNLTDDLFATPGEEAAAFYPLETEHPWRINAPGGGVNWCTIDCFADFLASAVNARMGKAVLVERTGRP